MSNYRIVSQAYPTNYWTAHGDEIITTANELHNDKWSFRESRQLLSNGLRARSFEATAGELKNVWAQGAAIWLFALLLQFVIAAISVRLDLLPGLVMEGSVWGPFVAGLALIAMSISTRWPVLALIASALALPTIEGITRGPFDIAFIAVLIVAVGLLAKFGGGRRVVSPLGLLAIVAVSLALAVFAIFGPGLFMIAGLILGPAIVRLDARLSAATTLMVLYSALAMLAGFFTPADATPTLIGPDIRFELVAGMVFALIAVALAALTNHSTRRSAQHF